MSMDFDDAEFTDAATMHGRDWPSLRQFCVVLENRVGSLSDLMRHLERHDVRIIALSIVDTIDLAIARVMLDQVERGRELFELSGFTFFENDVLGVELPEEAKPFVAVFSALLQAEINVNYMYPLLYRRGGRSAIAIHVEDLDTAAGILRANEFTLISEDDLRDDDEFFG
ncbi:MAG: acetolactate synthase [Planctomycetota bacterium]|jgi:hypothetical protein